MRLFSLVALAALFVLAAPVRAQSGFMPYLGYNIEDEDFLIGVGGRFGVPLQAPVALIAQPSIEYQFAGGGGNFGGVNVDVTLLQIDANVIASFTGSPSIAPYAGAGLGITYIDVSASSGGQSASSSNTELGLNLLGGVVLNPVGFGQPFAQLRYATRGDAPNALSVQAGVILGF
jgi:opacity protein-like surface antigen